MSNVQYFVLRFLTVPVGLAGALVSMGVTLALLDGNALTRSLVERDIHLRSGGTLVVAVPIGALASLIGGCVTVILYGAALEQRLKR